MIGFCVRRVSFHQVDFIAVVALLHDVLQNPSIQIAVTGCA